MILTNNKQEKTQDKLRMDPLLKKIPAKKTKTGWPFYKNRFFKQKIQRKWGRIHKTKLMAKIKPSFLSNKKGQGLIEYLILIALMGVATIGIIRTLNQTVKSRFANAIYALQGRNQKAKTHTMKKKEYQRSDLSNFMSGSASADNKKSERKR